MSGIEWTDETLNPIVAIDFDGGVGWHCEHVSAGCVNCYAEEMNHKRRFDRGTGLEYIRQNRSKVRIELDEKVLLKPLHWKKPRRVFVGSMTDLFAEFVPDEMLDRIFAVMALTPHITYQLLTKRPERMREYLTKSAMPPWGSTHFEQRRTRVINAAHYLIPQQGKAVVDYWDGALPLPNVWLGTSVEDQAAADTRIPELLATPAAVRFLSCEPLLEPVSLAYLLHDSDCWMATEGDPCVCNEPREDHIGWVIFGGESGAHARPCNIEWIRDGVRQCQSARVPVFVKQVSKHPVDAGTTYTMKHPHGADMTQWPWPELRVREFPNERR